MIDVDTFYKIKQLYHDGHLRVRIAEQLHFVGGRFKTSQWGSN
jgi:hypothetical protein